MKRRYNSIFLYSSLQFSGNIEQYFSKHSNKLVVFIVLPRFNNPHNIARVYIEGKLREEFKVSSSANMLMYYILWYKNYIQLVGKYFNNEKITVISFHPLSFLFSSLQRRILHINFVYWAGDYFSGYKPTNFIFRLASRFYNNRLKNKLYLSDRLNKALNGRVINTNTVKTVMWGVDNSYALKIKRKNPSKNCMLGFSGVIRKSQGIEELLAAMKDLPNVSLKILGPAPEELYKEYHSLIKKNKLEKNIYFPNKTIYGEAQRNMFKDCHIGIAMYDVTEKSATYYADPAKVKTYTEFGLPIIMTNAACVADYIKKYHAGIITDQTTKGLASAIAEIAKNYNYYKKGVEDFNNYFYYETYYKKRFTFLEEL